MNRFRRAVRGFAAFWWDFIVGDDWRIAAGVILALAATAVLATTTVAAWWIVPAAVTALLGTSLRRAATRPH